MTIIKECEVFSIEYIGVRHLLEKATALIEAAYEGLPETCASQISTIDLGLQLLRQLDSLLKADSGC